jgi:protein import protein ZIM17
MVSQADLDLAVQAVAENETTGLTDLPGAQKGGKKLAIVFTCKVCNTRAAKQFTEHAYQHGVVMVRCPGCEKYHLIADRLNFFGDDSWDIETFMASMGENVRAVTNDNVLELTVEDLMGDSKMREFRDGSFRADEGLLPDNKRTH